MKQNFFVRLALLSLIAHGGISYGVQASIHDFKYPNGSARLQFDPQSKAYMAQGEELARTYLIENISAYKGLEPDLSNVRLRTVKKSLAGIHYYFQQIHNNLDVKRAEIIVTLNTDGNTVMMVFNNIFPEAIPDVSPDARITPEEAYDIAWRDLQVRGQLSGAPQNTLLYTVEGKEAVLVYQVQLRVAEPFGAWQYEIDAATGKIVSKTDRNIYRRPFQRSAVDFSKPLLNRQAAFQDFAARQATVDHRPMNPVAGKGLVFDPDPRTTLNNNTLVDSSKASDFDTAYFERELPEISQKNGSFVLDGPWVHIEDFDSPSTSPSKTTDGMWQAKRGNNAFNDAMTYYHIDKSQRYMQSLGFQGETGIQYRSIGADSDGVNGDDNSYFTPTDNAIAFGHGCVDDNEDSDVLLHEYGHAIQYSINENWNGGDTGAMGEGFGDYWAGSYSISTPNGMLFFPNDVYSWDGHGPNDLCWSGRRMNVTQAIYDPNRTYPAHSSVGSFQSDELWSTPLFQALLTAQQAGIPREEMDRIVLQSHFGLGANVTMRELAIVTINTARTLYPNGQHAQIFTDKFAAQNIIEVPAPKLEMAALHISTAGDNAVVDPGEDVTFTVTVKNSGTLEVDNVQGELRAVSANMNILQGIATFGGIQNGGTATQDKEFIVSVSPQAACGEKAQLQLVLRYGDQEMVLPIDLQIGLPVRAAATHDPNIQIPDAKPAGIMDTLTIAQADGVVNDSFNVNINIEHTYIGDLTVKLISPTGKSVLLHNHSGGSANSLVGNYPATLTPASSLSQLNGETMQGTWSLSVADGTGMDTGRLVSWGIENTDRFECSAP